MSNLAAPLRRALQRTGYLTGAEPAAPTVGLAGCGGSGCHETRHLGGVDRLRPARYC